MTTKKCATFAIAGLPNAGKSTLINTILQQKIAIVSPKEQTTRNSTRGIVTIDNTQLIFVDSPGLFETETNRKLEKVIIQRAKNALKGVDFVLAVLDCADIFFSQQNAIRASRTEAKYKTLFQDFSTLTRVPFIVALNKIDACDKEEASEVNINLIQSILKNLRINFLGFNIISAATRYGITELLEKLCSIAPERHWLFDEGYSTDVTAQGLAEEITREKAYLLLKQELPYSLKVDTDRWEENNDNSLTIHQNICVLKASQKSILIGQNGGKVKEIGIAARQEIEAVLKRKVHLFIHIKVRPEWIDKLKFA